MERVKEAALQFLVADRDYRRHIWQMGKHRCEEVYDGERVPCYMDRSDDPEIEAAIAEVRCEPCKVRSTMWPRRKELQAARDKARREAVRLLNAAERDHLADAGKMVNHPGIPESSGGEK